MSELKNDTLKSEILNVLFEGARAYKEKLLNKNLAFLYMRDQRIHVMESQFNQDNYLHLTGVNLNNRMLASQFFEMCLNRRLLSSDFELKPDGTTELKLSVLFRLFNIESAAKMLGDFDHSRPKLFTEKIVGNIYACIGFVKDEQSERFVPNTTLKEDVRDVVTRAHQVVAIFSKPVSEPVYIQLLYRAKGFELKQDKLPRGLQGRVRLPEEKSVAEKLRGYSGEDGGSKLEKNTKDKGLER